MRVKRREDGDQRTGTRESGRGAEMRRQKAEGASGPCYLTVRVSRMGWIWSGCPAEDVALSEIVIVEVPEGVTTGGGVVIVALPPPQPARTNGIQKTTAARTPQNARRLLRTAGRKTRAFILQNANSKKRSASKIVTVRGTREMGGMRSGTDGGS